MVGRIKGSLETKTLEPALIRPEALRFDPDELVLDKGELIIVGVRVEAAPAQPPSPLSGKEWVPVAFERRRDELAAMPNITEAARALATESATAPDLAKRPLSVGYCRDELRKLNVWPQKPRNSPKRRPK